MNRDEYIFELILLALLGVIIWELWQTRGSSVATPSTLPSSQTQVNNAVSGVPIVSAGQSQGDISMQTLRGLSV